MYLRLDRNQMTMQLRMKEETIDRIESITGKRITKGGDKLVNEALTKLESQITEKENSS